MTKPADILISRIKSAQEARQPDWPIYGDEDNQLDRTKYLTSSENIGCLRKLWLEKNYPNLVEQTWGFAQRGHAVEAWIVDRLEESVKPDKGESLKFAGWAQRSFIDTQTHLSGTPDGVLKLDGERPVLIEIKSVDPRTNWDKLREAPKPQHYAQCQQNMYLLRHNVLAYRNQNSGIGYARLIYVNASNFEESCEFMIPYNTRAVDNAMARADELFSATHAEDLKAEGLTTVGGCDYCSFKEICSDIEVRAGRERKEEAPKSPPKFAPRGISGKLTRYANLQSVIKDKTAQLKELGAELKAHAEENDLVTVQNKNYVAEVETVAGRRSFDHANFEADNPEIDLEPYFKVGKPSVRLTVKERETE